MFPSAQSSPRRAHPSRDDGGEDLSCYIPDAMKQAGLHTNVELSSVHARHVSLFSALGFFSTNRGDLEEICQLSLPLALLTLYAPGLGQVSYESHDHPHVHPCPHGDGEGGHEQSSSGADSCPGEVSLGVGLACLSKQSRERSEAARYSSATSVRVGVKTHLREKARKRSP